MVNYLTDLGPLKYFAESYSWCKPFLKPTISYGSYYEAKEACSVNDACAMFYDSGGRGTAFNLCGESSKTPFSSKGSIRYTKQTGTHNIIQSCVIFATVRHHIEH